MGHKEELQAAAREYCTLMDTSEIVNRIRGGMEQSEHRSVHTSYLGKFISHAECETLIGQYAYRYSEDIRKERDYWRKLAMDFHDAVHAEVEKRKDCQI